MCTYIIVFSDVITTLQLHSNHLSNVTRDGAHFATDSEFETITEHGFYSYVLDNDPFSFPYSYTVCPQSPLWRPNVLS
jgi:hypothetical protein